MKEITMAMKNQLQLQQRLSVSDVDESQDVGQEKTTTTITTTKTCAKR